MDASITHHVSYLQLGLASIVVAAGVATFARRAQIWKVLRYVGLWAYMSLIGDGDHDAALTVDVSRSAWADDRIVPYWGSKLASSSDRQPGDHTRHPTTVSP